MLCSSLKRWFRVCFFLPPPQQHNSLQKNIHQETTSRSLWIIHTHTTLSVVFGTALSKIYCHDFVYTVLAFHDLFKGFIFSAENTPSNADTIQSMQKLYSNTYIVTCAGAICCVRSANKVSLNQELHHCQDSTHITSLQYRTILTG